MKNSYIVIGMVMLFSITNAQNGNDSTSTPAMRVQVDSSQYLVLKNSERIFGEVSYERPSWFGEPKLMLNKEKYNMSDVVSFNNKKGFYTKLSTEDSPKNRFLKRTTKGRIDLYSDDVRIYSTQGNVSFSHTEYVEIYFSKDKTNLLPIDYENLSKNLTDNIKSMQHLQNYQTLKYVQIGIATVGLGIVIAGLAKIDKKEGLTPGAKSTIFTGAIVMNLAWIPAFIKGGEITNAIQVYNE